MIIAYFEKKRVYGTVRYYPKNKIALLLVTFKRSMTWHSRKKLIKCLSEKEIKVVQKIGIVTVTQPNI
jgi:hypothetical protein